MAGVFQYGAHFADFLRKKSLKHLILHVTNHCNFRCQHCFIDFSQKDDLKLDQYQLLGKSTGPLFWLDIGGGEPFLRKDLADIIASFKASIVGIPTNGSLPDQMERQLTRLRDMVDSEIFISLSLDGLEDTHNEIRRQEGSWDQVWTTFERLRSINGLSVKINTVITNQNFHEIIPLMQEVRRRGPDFHSMILVRGETMEPDVNLPPLEDLKRLGPEIFSILKTYDYGANPLSSHILRNYHRYLWQTSLRIIEEETQVVPCLGGTAHMVVWGNGKVASCEQLESVGDLREQSWDQILKSQAYKDQVQFIKDKKCHCTHNCALLDSIFLNPASMSRLLLPVDV